MDTKKCNKCGKVKPLPEMTRRRDEEIGEFKYLSLCKSCKAEYQKKYKMENERLLNLGFASAVNKRSRLAAFIKNIKAVMESGFITGSARSAKERLTEKNTALSQFLSRQSQAYGI